MWKIWQEVDTPTVQNSHRLKIRIKAKSTVKAKENNTQKNQPHW